MSHTYRTTFTVDGGTTSADIDHRARELVSRYFAVSSRFEVEVEDISTLDGEVVARCVTVKAWESDR